MTAALIRAAFGLALLPALDIGHNISLPRPWLGLDIEKIDDVANSYPGTGESFEVKSCLVLTGLTSSKPASLNRTASQIESRSGKTQETLSIQSTSRSAVIAE